MRIERNPYGKCPQCDGDGTIVLMREAEPKHKQCGVCQARGLLDDFGCPATYASATPRAAGMTGEAE